MSSNANTKLHEVTPKQIWIICGLFAILLCLMIVIFVPKFKNILSARNQHTRAHTEQVFHVEPWMTFRYINFIYKLPDGYLKDLLKISSSKYPNLTIDAWAKSQHMNSQDVVHNINDLVQKPGASH